MFLRKRFLACAVFALAFLAGGAAVVSAWTNPNAGPPGGTSAVATTSSVNGVKRVGIGTADPQELVHIVGDLEQKTPVNLKEIGGRGIGLPAGGIKAVQVVGDYAYLLLPYRLVVVQIGNPAAPAIAGSIAFPGGTPVGLAVSGRYAYVVFTDGSFDPVGERVVDVASPARLRTIGTFGVSLNDISVSGRYAYVLSGSLLGVIDMADPAVPSLRGFEDISAFGFFPTSVAAEGSYAYVAGGNKLGVLNVANPNDPIPVTALTLAGGGTATDVFVADGYKYVTTTGAQSRLDVFGPNNAFVGSVVLRNARPTSVFVAGRYAYIGLENIEYGLDVVDISTLRLLTAGETSLFSMIPMSVAVAGRYAYLGGCMSCTGSAGSEFRIVEIPGIETVSGIAGMLTAGSLTVKDTGVIGGDLTVRGGLIANHPFFNGGVEVKGDLKIQGIVEVGGAKPFMIDHPLDPFRKVLRHNALEAPEMKTFYDGLATLDANGEAVVKLPAYFEALNRDYRYQLRAVGQPMPSLHVKQEIRGNQFVVGGGAPFGTASWQVTGIRKDKFAERFPLVVEEKKNVSGKQAQ